MPVPVALIAGGIIAGSVAAAAKLYSQEKQRELYRYQKGGYERQYEDYKRRLHGRQIVYPEFSWPGKIRALDTGISQSYASSIGTISHLGSSFLGAGTYRGGYGRSLYGRSPGRSSRYL